ncbi:MAG: hypothetical protein K2Y35_07700 [Burkholderiales bacterium]|nr:hypothetical protein [Burkholderiales bacterium]
MKRLPLLSLAAGFTVLSQGSIAAPVTAPATYIGDLSFQDADTLRMRARQGNETAAAQNLDLERDESAEPLLARFDALGKGAPK